MQSPETGREPPKIVFRPFGERMVMALGTLQREAEKLPANRSGQVCGVRFVTQQKVGWPTAILGPFARDQFLDHCRIGPIRFQRGAEIVLQYAAVVAVFQPVAPIDRPVREHAAPMIADLVTAQQGIDQPCSFRRIAIVQIRPNEVHGWNFARQIEPGPPQKGRIIGGRNRCDLRLGPNPT